MTPNTPQVGVTLTSHYFWRKFQAKTFRMSYPSLISVVWVLQNVTCIEKKKHVSMRIQTLESGEC